MNQQWTDIFAIPAPEETLLTGWLLVSILAIVTVTAIIIIRQTRPSQRAIRQIKSLHKNIGQTGLNNKLILQQLEKILCHRFATSRLSQANISADAWTAFNNRLIAASYSQRIPDSELTRSLFSDAINLVKSSGKFHGAG